MKKILIIDDDKNFCKVLSESLIRRNYKVKYAHNEKDTLSIVEEYKPDWALTDLKMHNLSGMDLIPKILKINPETKIIVLTGYADIETAISAIKLGAIYYLSKPTSTDEIINAFNTNSINDTSIDKSNNLKLVDAEKDHILNIFKLNNNNISATARVLGMHRRTLQRKLHKLKLI